jgi:CBS domain-containing protein
MTTRVIWVRKDASFREMAIALREHRVSAFPVLDVGGKVVGVVSEADLLTKEALDSEPEGRADVLAVFDRSDKEIRAEITSEVMRDEFGIDPKGFKVTVKDGVVTLGGTPGTAVLGHEIVRRIRHVQGVVAVRDRLSYPSPG